MVVGTSLSRAVQPLAPVRSTDSGSDPYLSVVVPVHNEQDNVETLYRSLIASLDELPHSFELVFVDDGSTDESFARLARLSADDRRLRLVQLRRNYGQTAASQPGSTTHEAT